MYTPGHPCHGPGSLLPAVPVPAINAGASCQRHAVACGLLGTAAAGARGCVSAVLFGDGETLKREQAAWANAVAVRESTRLLPC
ncbi:hypothetical protein PVAP13_7KG182355 [Panicum virgatum]|uniref:Uncharacterized protein n=1 Tax=Panicum virgatum TaxID=38727 RepID=A0A8T0QH53_PANVG|nr:hypothetical protein PVAP13_7KG182355 [Panicum virgatum]